MRLLVITAHPDDEVGSFGGSLLKYNARGAETYVICLTAGTAATHRGNSRNDDELGDTRRREFAASCEVLKVSRSWVLDYEDGALDRQDFYQVAGELVRRIREIRPQVILTFGGEGEITGHPDHSMTSLFATAAFHWAGRTNRYRDQFWADLREHRTQKLYYASADFTLPDRQPVSLAPTTCRIDVGEYFDTKINAFHQHVTQRPLFEIFDSAMARREKRELFHLVACGKPAMMRRETDLFEGVEE